MKKKQDHPLKAYRLERGISQKFIADKVGLVLMSIRRIEEYQQYPRLPMVAKIIKATGGFLDANDFLPPSRGR